MESHHITPDFKNSVSVIVPTKNASATITRCLESVKVQTYENIEILVVDAISSDETVKIASNFEAKILSFAVERAKAKNIGISESHGDFLLFLDADMELERSVVEECVTICTSNENIAGVIIPERSKGSGFWLKVIDFERQLYVGSKIESARFFRKKYVDKVKGFDEDIIFYEESTLPQKIEERTGKIVNARIKSHLIHNEEEFNIVRWLKKKSYYSETAQRYHERYEQYAKLQTSIIYRANLLITDGKWKILLKNPKLMIGLLVLKVLEFSFFKK